MHTRALRSAPLLLLAALACTLTPGQPDAPSPAPAPTPTFTPSAEEMFNLPDDVPTPDESAPQGGEEPLVSVPGGSGRLILHNGVILSMQPGQPPAQAIAIEGERIAAVGTDAGVLALDWPDATRIDLGGRAVVPGLIDSHAHWLIDHASAGYGSYDEAMDAALAQGWTSISELFVNEGQLAELRALSDEGRLRVRVNAYLPLSWERERFGDWYLAYPPGTEYSPYLRVAGVKIYADAGGRGEKFLSMPYADNPGYTGTPYFSQGELDALVQEAHQAGYQIAIHTGGDGALDRVLDAYERALAGESNAVYRHRVEHVMIMRDDQLERMARLGAIASVQLSWFHSDWREEFESNLGPERVAWVGRWRDLLDRGVTTLGSTDSPYGYGGTGPSMRALYQATTRIGESGDPPADWMLAQRITAEEALRLVTADAAYGTFQEDEKGRLAEGLLADLVVLSDNPLAVAPESLEDIEVLVTIVGGRAAYCAPGAASLCP